MGSRVRLCKMRSPERMCTEEGVQISVRHWIRTEVKKLQYLTVFILGLSRMSCSSLRIFPWYSSTTSSAESTTVKLQ